VSPPVTLAPADRPAADLIASIIQDAGFMAELTVHYLDRLGLLPAPKRRVTDPVALPGEFLLELAAALRLALWERAGLRDRLDPGLPPAAQALADLFARFGPTPRGARAEGGGAALSGRVFRTTLRRLARDGRSELNADIVLEAPADEWALEALADYLWAHRRAGLPGD
jgi:hypothetical protein